MSSAVVSIDLGILLPVLAPALGAAAVLVVDVLATRLRRTHYALALATLLVGAVATVPGLGSVPGDARSTLCLPASPGRCLYAATAVASGLQLAALLGAGSRCCWPGPRTARPAGRTAVTVSLVLTATAGATAVAARPRPRHLAGRPRAGHAAGRGAGRAARDPPAARRGRGAADHLAGVVRDAGHGGRALARRDRLGRSSTPGPRCWPPPTSAPHAGLLPRRRAGPGRHRVQALAGALPRLDPDDVRGCARCRSRRSSPATPRWRRWPRCSWSSRRSPRSGRPSSSRWPCSPSLSMTLGNLMALRQDDVVRLLAWSTVAQAGWVVLPLAAVSTLRRRASARLPAGLPRRHPGWRSPWSPRWSRLRGPARPGPALRPGRGLLREHPCWPAALGAGAALASPACRPACSGLVAKVVALRPVVAEGCGCSRWSPRPTRCSASRSTCAGCGCCSGRSRRAAGGGRRAGGAGRRGAARPRGRRATQRRATPRSWRRSALDLAALVAHQLAPDLLLRPARLSSGRAAGPAAGGNAGAVGTPACATSLSQTCTSTTTV